MIVAASGARPMMASAVSVLPEPDSPITPSRPPARDVERDAVDDAAPADLDAQLLDLQEGRHGTTLLGRDRDRLLQLVGDAADLGRRRRGASAQAGIDGVAQPVAEQVEAERGRHDGEAREHERRQDGR